LLEGVTEIKKNNRQNKMALKGNSKFLKYEAKNYSTNFSKLTRNDKYMTRNINNDNNNNKRLEVHRI